MMQKSSTAPLLLEPRRDYGTSDEMSEVIFLANSSFPLIITFFLQYSLTVVSIFSIGRIGKNELAAASLAIMTFNVTVSVCNGMATSLDTYCSQAYGAKRFDMVGLYFQRCTAMIFVIFIPIIAFWWNSGPILNIIVQEKELTLLAQTYLRIASFGLPGYICFETGKRYLQAQGIFNAGQYTLFIVAPLNLLLNYLLVWNATFGLGFIGAPIATAVSYTIMSLVLLLYTAFIKGKDCWYGFKLQESFSQWGPMMTLSLNGTIMLLSEFIAFEILTLASSRFGTTSLASQSIVSTLATLTFQVPFAVSVAASTRIANSVGAGLVERAKISNKVSQGISSLIGFSSCLALILLRKEIATLFTSDLDVSKTTGKIIIVLGVNQLVDSPNIIFAGCLRGQGRQKIGSKLNLISYYLIALPCSFYFGFHIGYELVGLWIGLGIGIATLTISEYCVLLHSNWIQITKEADKRNAL
ncbi:uncharacterized protein RJT20DRAFT_149161 [Scheffersomyces xylosifermentans]|uniref:uncharacterized protein n=1 Tax=Scheffersomyces xylosifermentans TaxID=1304137 RepID=UPI00315DF655